MEKIGEIIDTMNVLKNTPEFKELDPDEIRALAVEVTRINTIEQAKQSINNSIRYLKRFDTY